MHLFQQFQFLEQIGTLAAIILKFSDFLIATDDRYSSAFLFLFFA